MKTLFLAVLAVSMMVSFVYAGSWDNPYEDNRRQYRDAWGNPYKNPPSVTRDRDRDGVPDYYDKNDRDPYKQTPYQNPYQNRGKSRR